MKALLGIIFFATFSNVHSVNTELIAKICAERPNLKYCQRMRASVQNEQVMPNQRNEEIGIGDPAMDCERYRAEGEKYCRNPTTVNALPPLYKNMCKAYRTYCTNLVAIDFEETTEREIQPPPNPFQSGRTEAPVSAQDRIARLCARFESKGTQICLDPRRSLSQKEAELCRTYRTTCLGDSQPARFQERSPNDQALLEEECTRYREHGKAYCTENRDVTEDMKNYCQFYLRYCDGNPFDANWNMVGQAYFPYDPMERDSVPYVPQQGQQMSLRGPRTTPVGNQPNPLSPGSYIPRVSWGGWGGSGGVGSPIGGPNALPGGGVVETGWRNPLDFGHAPVLFAQDRE